MKIYTKHCVDPEAGYKLHGNMQYGDAINFNIEIIRCKDRKDCKGPKEIDDFINHLIVG